MERNNQAFKECQSQFEDKVKDVKDSENLDQRDSRAVAYN